MNDFIDPRQTDTDDGRLAYVKPDLVEAGKIADVTLSNGNNSGSDSAYS